MPVINFPGQSWTISTILPWSISNKPPQGAVLGYYQSDTIIRYDFKQYWVGFYEGQAVDRWFVADSFTPHELQMYTDFREADFRAVMATMESKIPDLVKLAAAFDGTSND